MNRPCPLLVFLILAAPLFAAEEEILMARVIDSSTDRIPNLTVAPEYPQKARRDRVEGEVRVCFDVDRAGRTRRVAVRRSSDRAFEKPSIKAVKASTFRPIGADDARPPIKSCRTFIFSLVPVEIEPVEAK